MSSDSAASVVIPAYQVADYIVQAIDSVLSQSLPAAEIIVVNDGSPDTDVLEHVLSPYMTHIRYVKQANGGPGAARNTGIQAARSDLIAFLDADDYWAPEFLARQTRFLEDQGVDMVYSNALYVLNDGTVVTSLMEGAPSQGEASLYALLEGDCTVATSTVVARKACLVAAGLFDESIGNYSEDFDLWLRVAYSGGRIAYQRDPLVFHRLHPTSLTAQPLKLPRGALQVLYRARERLDLSPDQLAALDRRVARIRADVLTEEAKKLILAGDYEPAYQRLAESTALMPAHKRRLAAALVRLAPRLARVILERRERRHHSKSGSGVTAAPLL